MSDGRAATHAEGRLQLAALDGMVSTDRMNELRELRRRLGLSQEEFAGVLAVSMESCRAWDCGRRPVPLITLARAREVNDSPH